METPVIIGIAGGTGSGKTTVARAIYDRVGSGRIEPLPLQSKSAVAAAILDRVEALLDVVQLNPGSTGAPAAMPRHGL